ncbi:MAG: hypothetical protein IJJ61_05295 [Clostridia bacterium]|nr:hypothetical protein [Clostridia bacterium]
MLFDTGLDIFDIKKYVSKLTQKELVVVNSRFHPDRANGASSFFPVFGGKLKGCAGKPGTEEI